MIAFAGALPSLLLASSNVSLYTRVKWPTLHHLGSALPALTKISRKPRRCLQRIAKQASNLPR